MIGRRAASRAKVRAYLWSYPGSSTAKIAKAIGAGRMETESLLSAMWGRGEVVLTNNGWKLGGK